MNMTMIARPMALTGSLGPAVAEPLTKPVDSGQMLTR